MSQHLQSGYHPDADQIGAFLEQALPAHEREQMLDHLAVCHECREIVSLSLPELVQVAPMQPVPVMAAPRQPVPVEPVPVRPIPVARKRWWSGWTLAWPLGGALAAAGVLLVYLHHTTAIPAAPPQIAVNRPTAPAPAQQPPAAPQVNQSDSRSPRGRMNSAGSANAVLKATNEPPKPAQALGGLIVNGRSFAAFSQSQKTPAAAAPRIAVPPSVAAAPAQQLGAGVGTGFGVGGGIGAVSGLVSKSPSVAVGQPEAQQSPLAQATAAPPPVLSDTAAANVTETVSVTNNNSIDTVSSNTDNLSVAMDNLQTALPMRPLPSHLAILSTAVQANRVLAVDTAHVVFVSSDAGKHWKTIHTPWQGHAVKAELIQLPGLPIEARSLNNSMVARAMTPAAKPAATGAQTEYKARFASPAAAGPGITGLITDQSGAVIPQAFVTATEIATGNAHNTQTDASGHYLVDGLAPGSYRVEAQARGFMKQQLASIAVPASGQSTANLTLNIGAAAQTVTVQAQSLELDDTPAMVLKSRAASLTVPLFQITTDTGARWTSNDGLIWKPL